MESLEQAQGFGHLGETHFELDGTEFERGERLLALGPATRTDGISRYSNCASSPRNPPEVFRANVVNSPFLRAVRSPYGRDRPRAISVLDGGDQVASRCDLSAPLTVEMTGSVSETSLRDSRKSAGYAPVGCPGPAQAVREDDDGNSRLRRRERGDLVDRRTL